MLAGLRRRAADALAYLRASPARLALVGAAFAGGALAGLPAGEAVYDYEWRDADFCDDCHVHDYANQAWAESVHGQLTTCHDCHRVPISHYPRNLWMMLADRPQGPEDIHRPHVVTVVCEQCHTTQEGIELTGPMPDAVLAHVVKVEDSPLHQKHLRAETRDPEAAEGAGEKGSITCMDCHGSDENRAHSFPATSANCVACHEHEAHAQPAEGEQAPSVECRDCHFGGFVGSVTAAN